MEFIKDFLSKSETLVPLPTNVNAEYRKSDNIKGCIFDIYGTLLISASGDIDQADITTSNLRQALHVSGIELIHANGSSGDEILKKILEEFQNTIKRIHKNRFEEQIKHPEIDIIDVWKEVIDVAVRNRWLRLNGNSSLKSLTFIFELLSNKVFPMPGMQKVIKYLHRNNKALGIVSNAQFYTPILMNFYLEDEFEEKEIIKYFDPDLTVYSYKNQIAKPDVSLFSKLVPILREKYSLKPGEVLFIGNDMYKDIYPAHLTGFQTALFAGDKRSLRLRKEKPELNSLKADYVITHLEQLLEII
jgi:putative hydrolase of the HAD superfamily